ncbi:CRISPR-associated endonuclease Cas1 [Desulfolucanica intricata]|uniref:CRISPR-associated endonuclease Cas1 n=1 Tax=Desulfolucanica intricata TaxID=1285191 RepID=UPI00083731CA
MAYFILDLGIEGWCSGTYFNAFAYMIRGDFEFVGRKHRPPPAPVKALLSPGYTLVTIKEDNEYPRNWLIMVREFNIVYLNA